jgi:hypothetical protein
MSVLKRATMNITRRRKNNQKTPMKYPQQKFFKPGAKKNPLSHPDWADHLPDGLPRNFDFSVVRTVDNAMNLLCGMPNSHRGKAAKALYEHRKIVGKRVAYGGLIFAWEHDHQEVISAFGLEEALAAALRDVSPPSKRKKPVRAWRGINNIRGAFGLSWTTDRDIACWFAMRDFEFRPTPSVLVCDLYPRAIIAEPNGRRECELIVDPKELESHSIFLDDGREEPYEIDEFDEECHEQVASAGVADWRLGYDRQVAAKKAELDRRLRRAEKRRARVFRLKQSGRF